jgi:plasmid stabilization system protein ParE
VKISFNALAEQELNDAAQYYELESPGLGSAFLAEVQRCCNSILEHPEAGTIIHGAIRRRLVGRFPYGILYAIHPGVIRVLAT